MDQGDPFWFDLEYRILILKTNDVDQTDSEDMLLVDTNCELKEVTYRIGLKLKYLDKFLITVSYTFKMDLYKQRISWKNSYLVKTNNKRLSKY